MQTILVVEDSASFRNPVSLYLRSRGYDVRCACDGEEALLALRECPSIAVVLLDLWLPKFDGVDVVAAMRSDPATRKLPVIVATAVDSPMLERVLRPSVQAWVTKTRFSLLDLLHCVRRFLGE